MDGGQFDNLTKRFGERQSRRSMVKLLGIGFVAAVGGSLGRLTVAEARKPCGTPGDTCNDSQPCCTKFACVAGVCAKPAPAANCSAGQRKCQGVCVSFDTDVQNCGGCGVVCPPPDGNCLASSVCEDGVCGFTPKADGVGCSTGNLCLSGETCLSGLCQGGISRDCPRSSSEVLACVDGECIVTGCKNGFADCDGDLQAGCEVSILDDPQNCGGCGVACEPGFSCCNGSCADLTSAEQCGSCDALPCNPPPAGSCWESATCLSGVCGFSPKSSGTDCDDGDLCTVTSVCDGAGACVPTQNIFCLEKPNTAAVMCQNGDCIITACEAGYADCDGLYDTGCEVATDSDSSNCGACGFVCPGIENGSGICMSGHCQTTCDAGLTNCGTVCLNTTTNLQNCGACGNNCADFGHHYGNDASCQNSVCVGTCLLGWADCDGNPNNGCETNIASDSLNCGACGNVCGDAFYCELGRCVTG